MLQSDIVQTGRMLSRARRKGEERMKLAAITMAGILTVACGAATAGEIRTELYGEGAVEGGVKPLYWDIYTAYAGTGRSLIILHGGGCRRGSRTNAGLVDLALRLAQDGITVVSPDYRLLQDAPTPGPDAVALMAEAATEIWLPRILAGGSSDGEAQAILQGRITACAAAAEDALTAWRVLRGRAPELGLDPESIALGGSSAGAFAALVAAYELATDDQRPAAVVSLWGAAPGLPFTHGGPPLWALHGADDSIVTLAAAEKTASRARQANVLAMLHVQQEAGHGWSEVDLYGTAPDDRTHYQSMLDFLKR